MTDVSGAQLREMIERADYEHMERIRTRVDVIVRDRETAEALKPWYRTFCKRPCFHDDYLEAFNRQSVTLVDTNGVGVQGFTRDGVLANGKEYKVDCVVLGTGFETGFLLPGFQDAKLSRRKAKANGFDIFGEDGLDLADKWAEGPRTLNGVLSRGFPNMFFLNGPQGVITNSATHQLDQVCSYLAQVTTRMRQENKRIVQPLPEAEEAYCQKVADGSLQGQKFYASCLPGYYNNEGEVVVGTKTLASNFPGGVPGGGGIERFFTMLQEKQQADVLEGLDIK